MTSIAPAIRSVCLLVLLVFLPSNLGFQLPNDSRRPQSTLAVVTHRQAPFLLTSQRSTRGFPLAGIFGKHDFSSKDDEESKSKSKEDEQAEETTGDDVATSSASESASEAIDEAPVEIVATDVAEVVATNSSSTGSTKSLLVLMNEIGNNFKDMAQTATKKGTESETQSKKILFAVKASIYYTLFILYRAYRGLFVLLPATFLQVYRKMEVVMDSGNMSIEEVGYTESGEDTVSSSSKWKTKLTVSILSMVVTLSYIVGGILKMGAQFFRTIAKTSDVPKSFEAAADEVMNFEGRISRVGKVNGADDASPSSGLAP